MGALAIPKYTVEEYFAMDDAAECPLEYHDGEVFEIEAATFLHGDIVIGLGGALRRALKGTPCRISAGARVEVAAGRYRVPDLVVRCGEESAVVTQPKVIVEILSPSTANFDRSEKLRLYEQIPTLEDIVFAYQDRYRVEVVHRTGGTKWSYEFHEGLDATFRVESLGLEIPLSEVYPPEPPPEL